MKKLKLNFYGEDFELGLIIANYESDGRIYLGLIDEDGESFSDLTVCLSDHRPSSLPDETYISAPYGVDLLEKYGIASRTGKFGYSGYAHYPLMKINLNKAREYEVKGE